MEAIVYKWDNVVPFFYREFCKCSQILKSHIQIEIYVYTIHVNQCYCYNASTIMQNAKNIKPHVSFFFYFYFRPLKAIFQFNIHFHAIVPPKIFLLSTAHSQVHAPI